MGTGESPSQVDVGRSVSFQPGLAIKAS